MERNHTFQWLEERGEIDHELMLRLDAKRVEWWQPIVFVDNYDGQSSIDEIKARSDFWVGRKLV